METAQLKKVYKETIAPELKKQFGYRGMADGKWCAPYHLLL